MVQNKLGVFTSFEEETLRFVPGIEKVRQGPYLLWTGFCNVLAIGALGSHWMTEVPVSLFC